MIIYPHIRPNGAPQDRVLLEVAPDPIPVQVLVDQAEAPQGPLVMLRFYTAAGMGVYFLPIEAAKKVAQMINESVTIVPLS